MEYIKYYSKVLSYVYNIINTKPTLKSKIISHLHENAFAGLVGQYFLYFSQLDTSQTNEAQSSRRAKHVGVIIRAGILEKYGREK